jgi:BirA family biotin operon repressor/biotin-[acetyl-CoA-carboxylase] ligase
MAAMSDDFAAAAASLPDSFRLLIRESAESTNDELRLLAEAGAPGDTVLIALHQTAGRGRRGAAWFSPAGEALAFSVLIRPEEPKALWPRLALAAGLAVAEAVESFGIGAGIKWPNDVWIGRRKVAGILVEAGRDFAIVGIGLNVRSAGFPAELSEIATSLRMEGGREIDRPEALAAVIRRLALRGRQIGADFPEMLESVRQRCVLTGHRVSLETSSGPQSGRVAGIGDSGELLLETGGSVRSFIQADGVRILDGCG